MTMLDISSLLIPIAHAQEAGQSTSPIATLGLNWKIFIAQLINFAVILFVLWRWVFTPVAKKLQERTDRIEKSMRDAASTEKEKQDFEHWKNEQMINTRHEASVIISKAQADAVKAKDEIISQTKEEQQRLIDQAKKQIEQEKILQLQAAKSELADLVVGATEKIIRQKLDGKRDEELIKDMLKTL